MIGLVDCNNFFVSCERVFRPELLGRPVIVLSNNDGCAVALSNEAKALGFRRGDPYFKIEEAARRAGTEIISGNHRLYSDMSDRVMAILAHIAGGIEVYSIDEAFIFPDAEQRDWAAFGAYIARCVRRATGIPVSVGLAPTRTLAKVASRFAKKHPGYKGACVIDTDEKRIKALALTDVADVWGIGRRHLRRLNLHGITTALQLASLDEDVIRGMFNVTGLRTWQELNGTQAITDDFTMPEKKTITCSRSFADDIRDLPTLRRAMAGFATIASRRLRRQDGYALEVQAFIATNRFHENEPQYSNAATCRILDATNDTSAILKAALSALDAIYRGGYGYKRAGLTITRITDRLGATPGLFADHDEVAKRRRLMATVDRINATVSPDAIRIASMGNGFADMTRRNMSSRLYTTRLTDIIVIHAR